MRNKFLNNPIEVSKQIWEKESIPVVSVRVNTFNHYKYLEECLQGILKQKTTFKIEILIYDDASTDNSKAIFSKYKLKYPDLFKIYISPENLYFGNIDTWIIYNLTKGKSFSTDVTNASRTMLFNIHTLECDRELLELFDIPKSMLPDVLSCDGSFGNLNLNN